MWLISEHLMEPWRLYLLGRVVSKYWLLVGNIYDLSRILKNKA